MFDFVDAKRKLILRVEFLLKTESGYLRDAEVIFVSFLFWSHTQLFSGLFPPHHSSWLDLFGHGIYLNIAFIRT